MSKKSSKIRKTELTDNKKCKYTVIAASIFAVLAIVITVVVLFARNSDNYSEKVKLSFEWSDLQKYEYDEETGIEYLTFRYIPPEHYGETISDYDWVFIRVNAEDYQPVENPERSEPTTSNKDRLEQTDTSIFPFWQNDMRLDNIQDSPNGRKSIITVTVPELESGHPASRSTSRFLCDGNTYTQLENPPFLNAYDDVEFATNTLILNSENPLYLYDTDTKQWFSALPKGSKYRSAYNIKPMWFNEREFLAILKDKRGKNYAARIDCRKQSVITLLPLKADVRYAVWSEKKIGVLWYQLWYQLSGATLYRLDMGIKSQEKEK